MSIKPKVMESPEGLPELKLLFFGQVEVEPGKVIPFESCVNFVNKSLQIKTQSYTLELTAADLTKIAASSELFELEKQKTFRPLTDEERGGI